MASYSQSTLYGIFQNDCISREDFSKLVGMNVLRPKSAYAFPTSVSVGNGKNTPKFSGSTAKTLAERGELLFFENWLASDYEKKYEPLHMGYYVYQDFIVIAAEPGYNNDTNRFGQNHDIDPVAIPLSRIKKITSEVGKKSRFSSAMDGEHRLMIWFEGSGIFEAKLFWHNPLYNCLIHDNWSLAVNSILCKTTIGVQGALADTITNQMKVSLESVISKCTDYEKRRGPVNVFDESVARIVEDAIYASEHDFVKLLVKYRDHLRPGASQVLKEKLDSIAAALEGNVRTIEGMQEEIKRLEGAIFTAESNQRQAGFFKKGKYKKEIAELSAQREQILQKIRSLDAPGTMYSEVISCFLTAESPTQQWSKDDIVLAKNIYAECKKRGIGKISSEEDKIILEMVSKQCRIKDIVRAMKLFDYGRSMAEQSTVKTKDVDIRKERVALENQYNKAVEQSKIVGWNKYLTKYYEKIAAKQKELAEYGVSYDLGINYAVNSTSKPTDWAIIGGLAQGIAGPAAGIMAAADVQRRNIQAAAASQKAREDGIKLAAYSSAFAKKAEGELRSILSEVEELTKRLYDADHPQIYFDYLSCKVCSYNVVMKNAMTISVDIECKKKLEFNSIHIAIDGSIRVEIVDGDQVIANAFICADGFGVTDFNNVGFRGKKTYSVVAMTTGNFAFNKSKQYTFRFFPEHIWMIEVEK